MEYHISIKDLPSCRVVYIQVKGKLSETDRNRIAMEAMDYCHNNNLTKVIWDIRDTRLTYSLIGSHLVVGKFKEFGVKKEDRIAIIYKNNAEQHRHTSIAAINRGITNIKYFDNFDEGVQWLIDQ